MLSKFRFVSRQLLLISIAICVFSCSKESGNYVQLIPENAPYVVAIDGHSLFKKGGFDKQNRVYAQFMDAVKKELTAEQVKQLDDAFKESSSGISFNDKIYFYEEPDALIYTFLFKVKNESKLKDLFQLLVSEGAATEIEEDNTINQYAIGNDFICSFDNNLLQVSMGGEVYIEHHPSYQAYHMKNRTVEESILSNQAFQQLMKEKGDVLIMANWDAIPYEFRRNIPSSLPGNIHPSQFTYLMNMTFNKGQLNIVAETYTKDSKIKEMYKDMEKTYAKVNSTYMDKFPLSTLFYAAVNLKGDEIYKACMKEPAIKEVMGEISEVVNPEDLLSAINGEIAVGVTDFSIMGGGPSFILFAEVKKDKVQSVFSQVKEGIGMQMGPRLTELEKDNYLLRISEGDFYFGLDKNTFYLTNDRLLYQDRLTSQSNSLKSGDWYSESKKGTSFILLNLEAIISHSAIRMLMALGGGEIAPIVDYWSSFSYVDAYTVSPQKMEFNIYNKDKEINFLEKSVNSMLEIAGMGFIQEITR